MPGHILSEQVDAEVINQLFLREKMFASREQYIASLKPLGEQYLNLKLSMKSKFVDCSVFRDCVWGKTCNEIPYFSDLSEREINEINAFNEWIKDIFDVMIVAICNDKSLTM